jgi:hypothetical protein
MADDEALADDPDDADVLFVPLLQAAAPRARPAVTAETATRRLFTITPLHLNVRSFTFQRRLYIGRKRQLIAVIVR